jgi:hypothetical protein
MVILIFYFYFNPLLTLKWAIEKSPPINPTTNKISHSKSSAKRQLIEENYQFTQEKAKTETKHFS